MRRWYCIIVGSSYGAQPRHAIARWPCNIVADQAAWQLDLQQTRSSEAIQKLTTLLPELLSLQTFSLQDHRLHLADARVLAPAIGAAEQLAALDLSLLTTLDGISSSVASALLQGDAEATTLRDLRSGFHRLRLPRLREIIMTCGGKLPALASLDFTDNQALDPRVVGLCGQLVEAVSALFSLSLQGYGMKRDEYNTAQTH